MNTAKNIIPALLIVTTYEAFAQTSINQDNVGLNTVTNCAALGKDALWNTGVPSNAYFCTAVGYQAINFGNGAWYSVGIGSQSLFNAGNIPGNYTKYNVAIGFQSMYSNKTGYFNVGIGHKSLRNDDSGEANTAIGASAMEGNVIGSYNTAVGFNSLFNTNANPYTGAQNVGATAVGHNAGFYNMETDNTAVGSQALYNNNVGIKNTALGYAALYKNAGYENTAIGHSALSNNTGGNNNTAVGYNSLLSNNSGNFNTAFGCSALMSNNMHNNVAGGQSALAYNVNGTENVAFGTNALYSNAGSMNVAIGSGALYYASNSGASFNTAIGYYAYNGLFNTTAGDNSTMAGVLTDMNGVYSNASAFGNRAIVTASNKVRLGGPTVLAITGPPVTWSTWSDGRFKSNVRPEDVKGLEFIMRLRPVTYNLDTRKLQEFFVKNYPDSIKARYLQEDFTASTKLRRTGFIAQEVEQAAKAAQYDFDGYSVPESDNDTYTIAYSTFVVPLVKAVQQQQELVSGIGTNLSELKKELGKLEQLANNTNNNAVSAGSNSEINLNNKLVIRPNPFSDEASVICDVYGARNSAKLVITNLKGQVIIESKIPLNSTTTTTITRNDLQPGLYVCTLITDNEHKISKNIILNSN